MRSIVAVTNEMDDPGKAVAELLEQVEGKGPLCKNSCGFVYCDVEMEHEGFVAALQAKLPFDLTGCTSVATFDTEHGAQTIAAVLVILTADDATFSLALTDPLTPENLHQELEAAYAQVSSSLEGPGKLLFLVPPFNDAITLDTYVDLLSGFSGDLPLFGGLPSSNMADGDILMYAKGRPYLDRAALILVGGNIRPIFSVQNVLSAFSEQKGTVSRAHDNIVYTVDGKTFVDWLRSMGMSVDELIAQGDHAVYVSTPLKVNLSKDSSQVAPDVIPISRTIKILHTEDGSGELFGAISENSLVSIATMKRQDIQDSCLMAIRDIVTQIKDAPKDYTYTTLLCVSCAGRFMVMADDKELEGSIILEHLLPGLSFSGFYAYGEICPTIVQNDRALNRVHNESIVMCAL